jgi:hypothetical protein
MRVLLEARRAAVHRQIEELTVFAGQLDEIAGQLGASPDAERCGPGCGCEVSVASSAAVGHRARISALPGSGTIECSLDAAAMADRGAAWRAITGRAHAIEQTPTGVSARFATDATLAAEIASLVTEEASCCPFLSLQLTIDGAEMELRIDAPAGAEDLPRRMVETSANQGTSL